MWARTCQSLMEGQADKSWLGVGLPRCHQITGRRGAVYCNHNISPIQPAILARLPPKQSNMYFKYNSKIQATENNTWSPPNGHGLGPDHRLHSSLYCAQQTATHRSGKYRPGYKFLQNLCFSIPLVYRTDTTLEDKPICCFDAYKFQSQGSPQSAILVSSNGCIHAMNSSVKTKPNQTNHKIMTGLNFFLYNKINLEQLIYILNSAN